METWLRENANIEVELSDLYNILCVVTSGDTEESIDALIQALEKMAYEAQVNLETQELTITLPKIPKLAVSPRDAFYAETELVPFEQSAGRIIAEFIMVYPPGIPILLPGEIITQDNLDYIKHNKEAGLPVQGPEEFDFRYIRVIKEFQAIK